MPGTCDIVKAMTFHNKIHYFLGTILYASLLLPAASAEFQNGPYRHVTPVDVGTKISVGVIGAVPTDEYTGNTTITSATTIENKVIISHF